ncbi:MAG: NAD(P)H-hydrate dehydratase [Elusimicrobia bacterium]|nr:NAD(P)H-hydrate dehydratase [Elusimicrobiota bacterium]
MTRVTTAQARKWLPGRGRDAHKGSFGHVLVVAGSKGMTGAAVLAARAALRAGAGLATVAVPASQQPIVAAQLPEALTLPLPETAAGSLSAEAAGRIQLAHRDRGYSVAVVGPGLSTHPDTARAVIGLLGSLDVPLVVDADALNILARNSRDSVRRLIARRKAPCVLTPHPGEAARLAWLKGEDIQRDREASAARLANEFGATVVLKGRATVTTDGERVYLNSTGNSGLAKGGTGDALSGMIAALWSQRLAAASRNASGDRGLEAAALAVFLHGLSADIAVQRTTEYCLLASDVIETLPLAFSRLT